MNNILKSKLIEVDIARIAPGENNKMIIFGDLKILKMSSWLSELLESKSNVTKAIKLQDSIPSFLPFLRPDKFFEMAHKIQISYHDEFNIVKHIIILIKF
jgi:hypothetical protein